MQGLSKEDIYAIKQAVFGEAAGADEQIMKLVAQSILNRYRSGRKGEFGATIPDILKKGYYAVSNPNVPYKQAVSGEFPDPQSKAKWGVAQKVVDAVLADEDFGEAQFYFTEEEENKLKEKGPKVFDFSKVKPTGMVGKYRTYSY